MSARQPDDADPFRALEHAGWQTVAVPYADYWGSLTTQASGPLLDAVGAARGTQLLDVATGPGYVAAAAAARGAQVVAVDFSAAMLVEAARRYPEVEFREGDAEDLPFPADSFDAVVISFGLLHLARPERALSEAHRVLRSGGRIGFTVWAQEAVAFGIVLRAVEAHGNPQVALPPAPPFFRFSDSEETSSALLQAAFASPMVLQVPQVWRLPSADALFEAMLGATVRTRALLQAQSAEALAAIRAAVTEGARAYEREGRVELPMPAVLASAVKP